MRQFKKKLGLMKVFMDKYERRALDKGSIEIYQAVMILVEENEKYGYNLKEDELSVLYRMQTFGREFSRLWGEKSNKGTHKNMEEFHKNVVVASLKENEFSNRFKNDNH